MQTLRTKNSSYTSLVNQHPADVLLSITDVCQILKKDRCTLYRWVKQNWIIAPIKINGRTKGWRSNDFYQWLATLN